MVHLDGFEQIDICSDDFQNVYLIRGSALPSATKSTEESLSVQGVCLCVRESHGCGRSALNPVR